jgi:hypothetical protein
MKMSKNFTTSMGAMALLLVLGVFVLPSPAPVPPPPEPDTTVTITASAALVCEGTDVTLTICESNTGDQPLDEVEVVVNDGSADIATLTAATASGDTSDPGTLNVGETWCWQITVTVNATTTYTATGTGTDPYGTVVTYPAFPDERDDVTVETEDCGGGEEGCTPGFWKNNGDKHGASAWCGRFSPDTPFSAVFSLNDPLVIKGNGRSTITNPTLLQALGANGGGVNAMIRHGVAAMLNACSDCVDYAIHDSSQVIAAIEDTLNEAPGALTVDELHETFAEYNEAGCPVDQDGECGGEKE